MENTNLPKETRRKLRKKATSLPKVPGIHDELVFLKHALDEHAIVSITDVKGGIIYVNDKFCDISGYSRDELMGQNHRLLFSGEHPAEFFVDLWKTISSGKTWHGEIKNKKKDGRYYWVSTTIVPALNDKGKPVQYFGIRTEITENKELEAELILSKEAADRANQAKSEFLSSMSHELRTPMNAVLGFAQMLEFNPKEPLSDAQKDCVGHIMTGGQHLLDLINDILDLAQIEAGKVDLSIEDILPIMIIEDCLPLITSMAGERGIEVSVSDAIAEAPKIRTDHVRIKQVLLNLLSNAIKYNRENGSISIGCENTADSMLRIMVTDTGAGIPKDKQGELFKPFSRLGAENTETEGSGIGLVVCKDLVKLMHGVIGLESETGKGSTFWIELPLCGSQHNEIVETTEALEAPIMEELPGMRGTVLYVEDNPANIRLMEMIVNHVKGLTLISTHTGEFGIELARAEHPDVIILDINLPGMNGIEVLKQLRRYDGTKDIPVLALSAAATQKDIEKGLNAGFQSYQTKPIKVPKIIDAIRTALETN